MHEFFLILLTAVLTNNIILGQFLGINIFMDTSKKIKSAALMGGTVIIVLTLSTALTGAIYQFILQPLGAMFL
jgi:electron transport complex protein RnfA